jgi:hypothetical protein
MGPGGLADRLADRLACGLQRVGALTDAATDPWWIIGSAALYLSGDTGIAPRDIDVLTSARGAKAMFESAGVAPAPAPAHARFRSDPFGRIPVAGGLDIEVMGDLHCFAETAWTPLRLQTRAEVWFGDVRLWVPEIAEQKSIFETFGRDKDLRHAERIARRL